MPHRLRLALATAVLVPLALAGCSDDSTAPHPTTTVRVWVVGQDTPQQARDYLKSTFEQDHPGTTLVVEEQSWTDLVVHLEESLDSSNSPDVVEMGNTQAPALTSGGYLREITDEQYRSLGGADLLKAFVEIGTWDDALYAVPYYASARVVFYSPSMVAEASPGFEVPSTLDDFAASADALTTDDVSGLYWPGQDWYNALPYVWENGGYIAELGDDGAWHAGFSTEGGIEGLTQVQNLMDDASHAGKEQTEQDLQGPFCGGLIAFVSTVPSFQQAVQSPTATDSCPAGLGADLTAFPLPSKSGDGPAQVFAGGSNLGISARSKHPDEAFDALSIMLGDKYQSYLGANNLAPAKVSLAGTVPLGDPIARAAVAAAGQARLTPATPRWADVESQKVMQQAMMRLAQGEDVTVVAQELDAQIETILNG